MSDGINVLSLFDGMSCGQIALERAGIKYDKYFASEIDKHAIKVAKHYYPETVHLGDVKSISSDNLPKIDLLIGGSPCFTGDSKVLTKVGYKAIKDIKVGDSVLSHTGKWRKVLKTGSRNNIETRNIKISGTLNIETTDEHPFYVKSVIKEYINQEKKYKRIYSENHWEKAENIDKSYFCSKVSIDINSKSSKSNIFWYLIGRYTGDGWYNKYRRKDRKNSYQYAFIICCSHEEKDSLEDKFKEFGHRYKIYKERTVYKFFIYSKELVDFVEKIGKGASNKIVHPEIFNCNKEQIKEYISGLWDSDGTLHKFSNTYRLSTTSYELALGVQQLIVTIFGVNSRIEFTKKNITHVIEGRKVNQRSSYTVYYKKDVRKYDHSFFEGKYCWSPVRSNESSKIQKTVYNLEVEKDNSYTVNNIVVHNCQGFSFSGKQLNFEDPRSKLFFEYVRLLKECKPKYFLLENVVMKKEYSQIITNNLGVEPITINSNLVSAQNRSRLYWTNIPGVCQPEDKNISLFDILEEDISDNPGAIRGRRLNKATIIGRRLNDKGKRDDYNHDIPITQCLEVRATNRDKSNCLTTVAKDNVLTPLPVGRHVDVYGRKLPYRNYTVKECCRLQTIPDDYFSGIVSDHQALKMLGNGWTVDVISHIVSNMSNYKK